VIESGPIRTIEQEIRRYGESRIIINRITYAGWPVTEYKIRVHWNEERMRLKLAIPIDMENPGLTAEIPGGSDVFPADAQEHVHGRWMTLEDRGPQTTDRRLPSAVCDRLGIAHTGLHGFDFDGKEIRLSVLRSAAYCHEQGFSLDSGPYHKFMDLGIHDFRIALWEDPSIDPGAIAEWLITPPLVWPHLPVGGA
jgi:alpha-mannosidase